MITFETKVWEKDWRYILQGDYLDQIIARCNYNFTQKVVIINNVKNKKRVEYFAQKKIEQGIIDAYYFAEDYADETLTFFNIDKSSFKGGYYYSIAELVSIYLCKTPYLLHFSSDAYIAKNATEWIHDAKEILSKKPEIIVANPIWNYAYNEGKDESISELEQFYVGYGFSDQCYLVKIDTFKAPIYSEKHDFSERYPKYGGELFEKRVDSYMRNNSLLRITSKNSSYIHKNFPSSTWLGKIPLTRKIIVNQRLTK